MNIVFRTDASIQIGTGHVIRCLTLADELTRNGHWCHFVCRAHKGHLGDLILSRGYGLSMLPPPEGGNNQENYDSWLGVPWHVDARQTQQSINSLMADWLVVDHYSLDEKWEKMIANEVGNIIVIDDLANRSHVCALLLDQNLGQNHENYATLTPDTCEFLIGPAYALLRPEFPALREQSLARRKAPELNRILITLGGVDRNNVTGEILMALALSRLPSSTVIDIVMGKTAPHLKEVAAQAADLPYQVSVNVNVSDMAERMCKADIAIGAAGSTSWERCCLGLPSLTIVLAANQRRIAESLSSAGATRVLDSISDFDCNLPNMELLSAMSLNAAKICDGLGVQRVSEKIGSFNA